MTSQDPATGVFSLPHSNHPFLLKNQATRSVFCTARILKPNQMNHHKMFPLIHILPFSSHQNGLPSISHLSWRQQARIFCSEVCFSHHRRAVFKQTRLCASCGKASNTFPSTSSSSSASSTTTSSDGQPSSNGGLYFCNNSCRGTWEARRATGVSLTPAQLRVAQAYLQAQANMSAIFSSSTNMENLPQEPDEEEEEEEQQRRGGARVGNRKKEEEGKERPVMKVKPEYLLKEPPPPPLRMTRRGGGRGEHGGETSTRGRGGRGGQVRGGREGRGPRGSMQRPPAPPAHQVDIAELPPPPALAPRPLLPPPQFPPPLLPPHPLLPPPTLLLPFPLLMPIPIPIPIPIPFPMPCKCGGHGQANPPAVDEEEAEPQPLVIDIKKEKGEIESSQQPPPQIPSLPKGTEVSLTPRTTPKLPPNPKTPQPVVVNTRTLSSLQSSVSPQMNTRPQQEPRRRSPALRQPAISGEEESRRKRRALIMDR